MKGLCRFQCAPPLHGISDVTLDFIEKLGSVTPGNLNHIKPFCGGSESTESAMKFVRQYFKQTGHPGKYKFVSRHFGYHGATCGAMIAREDMADAFFGPVEDEMCDLIEKSLREAIEEVGQR